METRGCCLIDRPISIAKSDANHYDRKLTETKTTKEALRALKRRISDVIYRQLCLDAEHEAGPGGQTGTTLQSSVTGPTPTAGSSDKPQPGPATEVTPT